MRSIELLSPAKNLDCGIAAINHGADAVYIGASKFGARAAAGNSIEDIAELTKYAHKFNARVYGALNTILSDEELEDAQKLIWQLYEAGTDALIIQDMGILQLDLPPIAIHASTQTDIRSVEKVQFLEKAGFSQVVLARELNLEQIKNISTQTSVPLEFFVHGALCVSYSGQCYISEALAGGRSANKGECAQYCRLPYDLVDANGEVLIKNKHLLSLKDLNLSDHLEELLEAGITSFKIEGRLKEADYVKNVTAFYRQKLDVLLDGSTRYKKSSSGKTSFFFTPNPEKTFHRGSTNYFLKERTAEITSFDTPKSVGEYIGKVLELCKNHMKLDTTVELHNGDGLCYVNNAEFSGSRLNRADGATIYLTEMAQLKVGTEIYRNYDIEFDKILNRKSAERKIALEVRFSEAEKGFLLELKDEDDNRVSFPCETEKELAQQEQKALETIRTQLSKLGNTDFVASNIILDLKSAYFIPTSRLADWRRVAVDQLEKIRSEVVIASLKERLSLKHTSHPYPEKELTYLANVHNQLAEAFYKQHGVKAIQSSFEKKHVEGVPLMFTRHCLKYSLGGCAKYSKDAMHCVSTSEPLYLQYKDTKLKLHFDCENCQMLISKV